MTVLGLEDGKVALYPHDEAWERMAEEMIARIRAVMKEDILDIQHVGGTSIRCSWAKPIIDIMILVRDYRIIDKYVPELNQLGIEYLGEMVPGQRLGIIRTPDGKGQTHHIHFAQPDCLGWYEIINIRDFCNTDPLGGRVYSESKRLYSKGNEDVRLNYREEKNNMYVVLRQAGQAMRARQEGKKTGNTFIDDLFMRALASLEGPAIVYSDGRKTIRYKELAGLLVRAAVKLKTLQSMPHFSAAVNIQDIAWGLIVVLGTIYCGGAAVLGDCGDRESVLQIQDDFTDDLMSLREHLAEADHKAEDPAVLFGQPNGSFESLSFQELSDLVQEAAKDASDYCVKEDHRLVQKEELISLLASLCAGHVIRIS